MILPSHQPLLHHYSLTSTIIVTFPWLIRAWWWIRGSIVHRINHEAPINHDLLRTVYLTQHVLTKRPVGIIVCVVLA